LARSAQSGSEGSLLVFNAEESVHIFVREGKIVAATMDKLTGEEALDRAWLLTDSSYRWIPDAKPSAETMAVEIEDYLETREQTREVRFKTIRLETYQKRDRKLDFQYFFMPEEMPSAKLRLKKATNVVGRDASCDLVIDNFQVSRRHCLLEVLERGVAVKDLDSTNGTFVNGAPVKDGTLYEGDRLSLGTYGLTLRREKV
jgi:hypothetical protein